MTPHLSPCAQRILARLAATRPDLHTSTRTADATDASTLSRQELGAIWDALQQALAGNASLPAHALAEGLLRDMHALKHWPLLNDVQVMALLERGEPGGWGHALQAIGWRQDRSYPLPAAMQAHLQRLLGDAPLLATRFKGVTGASLNHYAVIALCMAHHMAPQARDEAIALLTPLLALPSPDASYREWQMALTLSLNREDLLAQSWTVGTFNEQADPRYAALHERVLRDACARVEAIHRGDAPYVPYKAFAEDDTAMVTQAFHYFAAGGRQAPWLPEVLRPLLVLLCHSPDKSSRGMPSQTLGCKLAEEISQQPTPEFISALQAAGKQAINNTVLKVLGQRLQQARAALALRPEVVLGLVASAEPDRKQQAQLTRLLQASWWTGLEFSLADWRRQLALASGAGELVRQLIWHAQPAAAGSNSAVSFMAEALDTPDAKGNGLRLTGHDGAPVQLADDARVRLWHPLHSTGEVRQAWQALLTRKQLRQPLRQAFREYYELQLEDLQAPTPEDNPQWCTNENWHYAGHLLALKPLIALAKSEGWKLDKERGLVYALGPLTLVFTLDARLHTGVEGDAQSLALAFWRTAGERHVRVALPAVPPLLYSEACRAADLLVSALAPKAAMQPETRHAPRVQHLAATGTMDMTAMRAHVLAQAFAPQLDSGQLTFDGCQARVGDYAVNLDTAHVSKLGETFEVKVSKAAKGKSAAMPAPWLPYDEVLLEKLAATLAMLA